MGKEKEPTVICPAKLDEFKVDHDKQTKLKFEIPPLWHDRMMKMFVEPERNYEVAVGDASFIAHFGGYSVNKEMVGTLKLLVTSLYLGDVVILIKKTGDLVQLEMAREAIEAKEPQHA